MTTQLKATDIDRKFDDGEDVMEYFDMSKAVVREPETSATRKMNLTVPTWMVERLDSEAGHLAVSRNALVNMWLADRIKTEDRERELVH
ncbi:type II toxin-antitoxin system BrnA family antitoxin [Bifidobacterium saguinibicoloris]|uniref:type II toxin-antitoxin system BrnA family antitoxin n=1 Tax=Bifidobacterium saguinibicoloris TaxID=2834433 RepID=UPI001C5778B8|nr:BrnA antitoxin family protein [Bifidobacterium saguinibicoloris]MBW3081702.1 hypothetical protein [Bifidobacterium saguinibicoloris]